MINMTNCIHCIHLFDGCDFEGRFSGVAIICEDYEESEDELLSI